MSTTEPDNTPEETGDEEPDTGFFKFAWYGVLLGILYYLYKKLG